MVLLLLLYSLWGVMPSAGASSGVEASTSEQAPACPANYTCASMPCPAGQDCGTVEAGPTSELGPDQWVYINLYDFAPGATVDLNYCADVAPLTTEPLCVENGSSVLQYPEVPIDTFPSGSAAGTASISFQVVEVASPNPPLTGGVPGNSNEQGESFYCDGASQACSIDVTEPQLDTPGSEIPNPTNTVVIPVSFAPSTSGCSTGTIVNAESEAGISQTLLAEASRLSCANDTDPTIAFDTEQDGPTAVQALSQGAVQVAFTDDPEAADEQASLKSGNFDLIPIALTAEVIGFKATMATGGVEYPDDSLDLTPDMVAGLVAGYFTEATNADLVPCAGGCPVPPCLSKGRPCSLLGELNYTTGFQFPKQYGAFVRSDNDGTTDELFQWLCSATSNESVPVNGTTEKEKKTAPKVLLTGLADGGQTVSKCSDLNDTFPALNIESSDWSAVNDPSQQSLKLNALVAPPGVATQATAGFAPLVWSEAAYFGMNVAALQNAAGDFVLPTEQSVDAALADATTNADGTITPKYDDPGDPAAYPLPTVVYAAVPAGDQPASQATQLQDLLTQILDLTGGADTADLPAGFLPLTPTLYQQAEADITKDIIPCPDSGCPTSTSTSPPSTSSSSGSSGGSTKSGGSSGTATSGNTSSTAGSGLYNTGHLAGPSATPTTGATPPTPATNHSTSPPLPGFSLASSASRLLLPLVLVAGALALVAGGLLLVSAGLRRHTLAAARLFHRAGRDLGSATGGTVRKAWAWLEGNVGRPRRRLRPDRSSSPARFGTRLRGGS